MGLPTGDDYVDELVRSHAAARDARSMKPVPVSSVERVRCQYAGDGDRKARRVSRGQPRSAAVSRGAGAEMKKNAKTRTSKTKNRRFTNRRRHRFSQPSR